MDNKVFLRVSVHVCVIHFGVIIGIQYYVLYGYVSFFLFH